jgi:hypothetical protein
VRIITGVLARAAAGAQASQHFEAVHPRQGQIEDDERVILGVQEGVGVGAGVRRFDGQVGVAQGFGKPVREFGVVFNKENAHRAKVYPYFCAGQAKNFWRSQKIFRGLRKPDSDLLSPRGHNFMVCVRSRVGERQLKGRGTYSGHRTEPYP